ncbi:MAG TPA: zinc-binding dehydrogenase [Gemmatimonadaceae bacterium]|nr:zinc-binding dehydrogenase [Gemmatimonadaceae bacterium]
MLHPTYTAAVFPAPHVPPRLENFPQPGLEPGAAVLHTLYSEVCGTDVHLHHGRLGEVPFPIIPGHVSVGAIAAMRGTLTDVEGRAFREGDVVTFLDVHESCNHCYQCLVARQSTRCPHRKVYGITYSARDGLLGGWAEGIWIKPGVKLLRLPDGLDPETFIGGGCGLVTALHAIDRAELRLGQSVAVLGVGPVGQSIVALASLSGAGDVIAVGDPPDRLGFAERMGATATLGLDLPPAERLAIVRERTRDRGVDVAIEASGSPDAVSQALDLVRDGGRVVVCGHYTDNGAVSLHPHYQINRKHVEIRGCWGSDYSHFHRAVEIAAHHGHRIPWREMVTGRYPLAAAAEALEAVASRAALKALIVPNQRR